jgi:Zn-finger nucleic acid-binding protein
MTDRQGIEIDYCPQCRGVWLDRGELDKIIERTGTRTPSENFASDRRPDWQSDRNPPKQYRDDDDDDYKDRKKRKKRGLLGELFDFD